MLHTPSAETVGKFKSNENNVLGSLGSLEVRLASNEIEIAQALSVRQKVFNHLTGDQDRFDAHCDHLIVLDNGLPDSGRTGKIVATYRLLQQDKKAETGGYYSASEFDIEPLLARHSGLDFLEFGRSCVLPAYRGKRTLELLWHGSWAYVRQNSVDVMFGCASFPGVKVEQHREALSFLAHNAAASADWEVAAIHNESLDFELMGVGELDMRRAIKSLPPLIKGYLRLGAMYCRSPVIDYDFGTIDVLVLLPISRLNPKYVNYYGSNAERFASS